MKSTQSWVSVILLGMAMSTPTFVQAGTTNHPETNSQAQKAANDYNKELRKVQKQQAKTQKKNVKQFKKMHPEAQHL